jgi:hypothetical protein
METVIVREKMLMPELMALAAYWFTDFAKAVVDIEQGIIAVGAELHSDQEALLLAQGSKQEDLWGVNLYPELTETDWIEFDSMINLRPRQGNRSRGVEDEATRRKITEVVNKLIKRK